MENTKEVYLNLNEREKDSKMENVDWGKTATHLGGHVSKKVGPQFSPSNSTNQLERCLQLREPTQAYRSVRIHNMGFHNMQEESRERSRGF